jgi:hypothetical protein
MTPRRWTLAVVCAATAMLMLDIAVVYGPLPDRRGSRRGPRRPAVGRRRYTLALAATVLTFGSLPDRFGRRRLFTAGLSVFTLASGACAAATGAPRGRRRAARGAGARPSRG